MASHLVSNRLNSQLGAGRVIKASIATYHDRIEVSRLSVTKTQKPKAKTPYEELLFGHTFTDHMLEIDWDINKGWHAPKITPYQNLSLSPASTCLQYGIECFEGMKAYLDKDENIRLFRPDRNMARLNFSMVRMGMPRIDMDDGLLDCIKEILKIDKSWIPNKEGYSLYLRPTAIGTSPFLGVQAAEHVKLFTILCPVGPYYRSGFNPVKLYADTENVRAWPGGVGNAKVGGNYAPTILPSREAARKHGCSQILWLFGENHEATEVGAMNIFFVLKKVIDGKEVLELATAPLTRGDILPGVTRASILELARELPASEANNLVVSERFVPMGELVQASKEGRLVEIFGAGTAAVISPVGSIIYKDSEVLPSYSLEAGPLALKFYKKLLDIQYGRVEHPWSVVVK